MPWQRVCAPWAGETSKQRPLDHRSSTSTNKQNKLLAHNKRACSKFDDNFFPLSGFSFFFSGFLFLFWLIFSLFLISAQDHFQKKKNWKLILYINLTLTPLAMKMHKCVSTASSVLVNGTPKGYVTITCSRGLHNEDSLSPFLFPVHTKRLEQVVLKSMKHQFYQGLSDWRVK